MVSWMEMDPRIRPLKVAMWNNLKGGGDSLTKLADICQEKNCVRSDNLVCLHQDSFERALDWCFIVAISCARPWIRPPTQRYCTSGMQLTSGSHQKTR